MKNVSSLEAVYQDYHSRNVNFYYVYKSLAHPEHDGFVTPFTLQERLMHVKEAKRRLGTQFTWICDSMDNSVKHALGDAPNSEFVIDPDGVVARKRVWSNPKQLRTDLEELVGPVENPTETVELQPVHSDGDNRPPGGVVARVKPSSSTWPLRIEPIRSQNGLPFYVKLRAEADEDLLDLGSGQMYLGFHLDPIYRVHWNDRADPLRFALELPQGVKATPSAAAGPELEVEADVDPREFLIEVEGDFSAQPIGVKVDYFACDDDATFCVPVSQQYKIYLQLDPEGGWVFARGGRPRRGDVDGLARSPAAFLKRLSEADADGDGKLSHDESPPRLRRHFAQLDANEDGFLDKAELDELPSRLARWRTSRRLASGREPRRDGVDPIQTVAHNEADSDSGLQFHGHLQGRLRGSVDARLRGNFRGRLRAKFEGATIAQFEGRFEGQIDAHVQGQLDGEFDGEFQGSID